MSIADTDDNGVTLSEPSSEYPVKIGLSDKNVRNIKATIETADNAEGALLAATRVVIITTTTTTAILGTADAALIQAAAIVRPEKNIVNSEANSVTIESDKSSSNSGSSGLINIEPSGDDAESISANNEGKLSSNSSSDGDDQLGKNSTLATTPHHHQQNRQRISAVKVTPPSTGKTSSVKSTKIEMPAGLNYVLDSHPANKHNHPDYR